MKIFNVINNSFYCPVLKFHQETAFYLKPETALFKNKTPFYFPDFSNDIRCNLGILIRISKLGKNISLKFAHQYYTEFTLCINLFAYDLVKDCIENHVPWDKAVSFDSSTIFGSFRQVKEITEKAQSSFSMTINKLHVVSQENASIPYLTDNAIANLSEFYTLKIGDYIIIELLNYNSSLHISDTIAAFISEEQIIEFKIK